MSGQSSTAAVSSGQRNLLVSDGIAAVLCAVHPTCVGSCFVFVCVFSYLPWIERVTLLLFCFIFACKCIRKSVPHVVGFAVGSYGVTP